MRMEKKSVSEDTSVKFIVIGGGIAGVTCAETLSNLAPDDSILLITASPLIKAVTNFQKVTKTLEEFDVEERPMFELHSQCPKVRVIHATVTRLNSSRKVIHTSDGSCYGYEKLCIASGGSPKVIDAGNPLVLGIRDTETVQVFQQKLAGAKRILIVGNGGIATELVHEIENCEVIWAIKDDSITHTFIDEGASAFFTPILNARKQPPVPAKRTKYTREGAVKIHRKPRESCSAAQTATALGSVLGPDWAEGMPMRGAEQQLQKSHRVHLERQVEIQHLLSSDDDIREVSQPPNWPPSPREKWPLYVELTNGKVFGCDFVVSATGVNLSTEVFNTEENHVDAQDGGLVVDNKMKTSAAHVFAAGDVCYAGWDLSPYWLQMRLWSQARQMGAYAAQCMQADASGSLDQIPLDFCFELFAHVTRFFNFKVVLLGKFNAQGLGPDHELLVRVTEGVEYVKVVLKDGHMHGALLVGETDLEETFENLILNQMDLTAFKDHLLDPNIDVEDFFD